MKLKRFSGRGDQGTAPLLKIWRISQKQRLDAHASIHIVAVALHDSGGPIIDNGGLATNRCPVDLLLGSMSQNGSMSHATAVESRWRRW